jgi:hypothetical protein
MIGHATSRTMPLQDIHHLADYLDALTRDIDSVVGTQ